MEEGFVRGSSDNLPRVDFGMIDEFYIKMSSRAEARHVKMERSTRPSYGDNAVAYVQLKRDDGGICHIKGKITPEHKIHKKYYNIVAAIDENKEEILRCECLSCAASADHCKHAVAFLFWLHRRSEEPAVTSKTCYWKGSSLSKIGKSQKYDLSCIVKKDIQPIARSGNAFLYDIIKVNQDAEGGVFDMCKGKSLDCLSVHKLSLQFSHDDEIIEKTPESFIEFMKARMDDGAINKLKLMTREQSKCPLWFEMRFGRITASRIREASKCKTFEGALTESILGASKLRPTEAMKRGILLEKEVLKRVAALKNIKIVQCGLILNKEAPIFGASPDGVTDEYVIEIKCPKKERNVIKYVKDNIIAERYEAQVQLQMLFAKKKKGLFCVAAHDFETSNEVSIHEVTLNEQLCNRLMKNALTFWQTAIYPILMK